MTRPPGAYQGREDDFQESAINLARLVAMTAGVDPALVMHIPNGGARSAVVGAKLKRAGVVRGYPDIMVFDKLALELKVWPNRPSQEQLHIHTLLRHLGWHVEVCYSMDAVNAALRKHFKK